MFTELALYAYLFAWALFVGLTGCHKEPASNTDKPSNPAASQELVDKSQNYCAWARGAYEMSKWVVARCDGVGFTALHSLECPYVDLQVFEDAQTGQLFRDPDHTCFVAGGGDHQPSDAGLSKDMILMRLVAAFEEKDVAWVNRFVAYGEAHTWIVCDAKDDVAKAGDCVVTPALVKLIYDTKKALEGHPLALVEESADATALQTGFQGHLQVLGTYLSGRVHGGLTATELATLKGQAERQPQNAVYQAAYHRFSDGNQTIAWGLLGDLTHFPGDKLPSNLNYCTEYLYQRDEAPGDWAPCVPAAVYSGTDYLVAFYIARGTGA